MTMIFLTQASASPWTVPADWNSSANTIEVIGGGGGGINAGDVSGAFGGQGGGGGAYSKITNLALTGGGSVNFSVGAGGSGGASPTAGG
ncbi:MAG TPA: hypothetical protein VFQ82_03730, partial [Stellaceae bacterium]|nr:hypothetical protein [Stellaceae bacterium]